MTKTMLTILLTAVAATVTGGDEPMILHKETMVDATPRQAWRAWTTEEGLRFISGRSNVELTIGGPYEWFLDLEPDHLGRRGGEGSRILSYVPEEMLAFTWTFPPSIPELRDARETTQVVVRFHDTGDGRTRVTLDQLGWREGEPWRRGVAYFDAAWGKVLERFAAAMATEETDATSGAPEEAPTVEEWQDGAIRVRSVDGPEKRQEFVLTVAAPAAEAWSLLTTEDGLRRLGASEPDVELEPGGPWAFWPGATTRVMAFLPERMLATTGSAPPEFPRVREGGTWSMITLTPLAADRTEIRCVVVGWIPGDEEYDRAFQYFLEANPRFFEHVRTTLEGTAHDG